MLNHMRSAEIAGKLSWTSDGNKVLDTKHLEQQVLLQGMINWARSLWYQCHLVKVNASQRLLVDTIVICHMS